MHPDEREFFKDYLFAHLNGIPTRTVFDFWVEKGVNYKRLCGWVEKWYHKGIWNYGVNLLSGWFVTSEFKNHKNYQQLYEEIGKEKLK